MANGEKLTSAHAANQSVAHLNWAQRGQPTKQTNLHVWNQVGVGLHGDLSQAEVRPAHQTRPIWVVLVRAWSCFWSIAQAIRGEWGGLK